MLEPGSSGTQPDVPRSATANTASRDPQSTYADDASVWTHARAWAPAPAGNAERARHDPIGGTDIGDDDVLDATPYLPARRSLSALRAAAANCRACALHECATQTVFGEGPCRARLMLVGEIPGDQEDRAGRVFVGPAGRELDHALEAVGIARDDTYVTNAVKHFKFEQRGKRRIHQKPSRWEVRACNPWLRAELDVVRPQALVLLGATAGQALLGPGFKVGESRGRPINSDLAEFVTATAHPSAILRTRDDDARSAMRAALAADLRTVAEFLSLAST